MVKRGIPLPKKLKYDAIIEAVFELRFDIKEISEVFFGRFIDRDKWKGWQQRQLPAYNIPAQFRSIDPNIKYAPIIELIDNESKAILRLGPSVVSYHRQAPYIGWEKFKPELIGVIASLFGAAPGIVTKRLGLRYMNALRPGLHNVRGVADLDIQMSVFEDVISRSVNLNFITKLEKNSSCAVRIATPEFIQGVIPADTSVFVDVDVYTDEGFSAVEKKPVEEWIEFAHTQEKIEFFHLFGQATIDKLKEE
jgi:uncharacterized protein (TIGR04255 family)